MLTSDLLRVRVVKAEVKPQFVKTSAPRHIERAERMLEVFQEAVAAKRRRADLIAQIREIEGLSTDHKLIKGLAKVLLDKCEFAALTLPGEDALEPPEIRQRLFRLAVTDGPVARRPGPTNLPTATSLTAQLATELGCTPEQLAAAMYADLKEEQILIEADLPGDARGLLERYNVALVQSVLLRASRLSLTLHGPTSRRLRQIFRYLKFHQLMYRITRKGKAIHLLIDGPESLLRQSTRYGLQLATFFPALLLQDCKWEAEAEIMWGNKRKVRKALNIASKAGLKSHYKDRGAYKPRAGEWFETRFTELSSSWKLSEGEVLDLGNQDLLVPDYTFRRSGRVAHLDILGFWRGGYLIDRLSRTPSNVILAVSRKLAGEINKLSKEMQLQVVTYAEIIPAKEVLSRLEMIAEPREPSPSASLDEVPVPGEDVEQKPLF
jgi:predicted nuclease of restriction endonuclease-like RecB superfamily